MNQIRNRRNQIVTTAAGAMAVLFSVSIVTGQPTPGGMGFVEKPKDAEPVGFESARDEVVKYVVDASSKRNEVVFTSTAPKETIKGQTKQIAGDLTVNPRTLTDLAGHFEVDWNDISTGKPMMDEHMRAEPWVNAGSHPKITFNVNGFKPARKQPEGGKVLKGKLIGSFAMNGRVNPVEIPVTLAYVAPVETKKGKPIREAFGIKAAFTVKLSDYGIEGKGTGEQRAIGNSVAEKLKITVSVMMAREGGDSAPDTTKKATRKGKKTADPEA